MQAAQVESAASTEQPKMPPRVDPIAAETAYLEKEFRDIRRAAARLRSAPPSSSGEAEKQYDDLVERLLRLSEQSKDICAELDSRSESDKGLLKNARKLHSKISGTSTAAGILDGLRAQILELQKTKNGEVAIEPGAAVLPPPVPPTPKTLPQPRRINDSNEAIAPVSSGHVFCSAGASIERREDGFAYLELKSPEQATLLFRIRNSHGKSDAQVAHRVHQLLQNIEADHPHAFFGVADKGENVANGAALSALVRAGYLELAYLADVTLSPSEGLPSLDALYADRAVWVRVRASEFNLRGLYAPFSHFIDCTLQGCDLRYSDLRGAQFYGSESDLSHSNFRGSFVGKGEQRTDFASSLLHGANLTNLLGEGVRLGIAELATGADVRTLARHYGGMLWDRSLGQRNKDVLLAASKQAEEALRKRALAEPTIPELMAALEHSPALKAKALPGQRLSGPERAHNLYLPLELTSPNFQDRRLVVFFTETGSDAQVWQVKSAEVVAGTVTELGRAPLQPARESAVKSIPERTALFRFMTLWSHGGKLSHSVRLGKRKGPDEQFDEIVMQVLEDS